MQEHAHRLIPGGAHTYAKGDDQYPAAAPPFLVRGAGCRVWDLDGNDYIEYGMGLRSVTLGHAHPSVVEAAVRELRKGQNFARPSPIELQAAEALASMVPSAEMVKFCKNGSDATTAAVKLARSYTGRDLVAICADHPFLSTDDWFIGSTPMSAGIPAVIRSLTVSFPYNDLDALRRLLDGNPGRIACLVMEGEGAVPPLPGYLQGVEALCRDRGGGDHRRYRCRGTRHHRGSFRPVRRPRGRHGSPRLLGVPGRDGGHRISTRSAGDLYLGLLAWRRRFRRDQRRLGCAVPREAVHPVGTGRGHPSRDERGIGVVGVG